MKKQKVALLFICLNQPYWPYLKDVVEDAKKFFLTNHQVDFFIWSDMPELGSPEYTAILNNAPPQEVKDKSIADLLNSPPSPNKDAGLQHWARTVSREVLDSAITYLRNDKTVTVIPTEPIEWPAPTLMRYHLFLQQEEALKDYDYLFYLDADMRIVSSVGEEVMGQGLTMAEHPMYSLRRQYIPPYEPNLASTAHIRRFGVLTPDETGRIRFKPLYAAGGFQGGTSTSFIKAMKEMRKNIDKDFNNNYVAIWNDESHWNKYLSDYEGPSVVLTPSYIYPDSLIKEYYEPLWGCAYTPKIITLTKPFSVTKEGGAAVAQMIQK